MFSWLKGKLTLAAIGFVWVSMIYSVWEFQLVITLLGFTSAHFGYYSRNFWLAQDHLVNVIFSGHFKTTVSAKLGKMSYTSASANMARLFVDWAWEKVTGQDNHCRSAIEQDDEFNWNPMLAVTGFTLYTAVFIHHIT